MRVGEILKVRIIVDRQMSQDVRVVKELDLKSSGLRPRRFEPCS